MQHRRFAHPQDQGTTTAEAFERRCGVRQPGNVCSSQPVVGALAVHVHPDAFHLDDEPTFGIVLMRRALHHVAPHRDPRTGRAARAMTNGEAEATRVWYDYCGHMLITSA